MENKITVFQNSEFGQVRTVVENDKILFCASDVAKALGYSNAPDAVKRHCKCVVKRDIPHPQNEDKVLSVSLIPEGDIYRLIVGSKLPGAEAFEEWLFEEVVPSIRKTGEALEEIRYSGIIDGLVYTHDGIPMTTSILIAKKFSMQHQNIIQAIEDKLQSPDTTVADFSAVHIHESQYVADDGRVHKQYELDKQGFSFIALGLTDTQADIFKIQYIDAFTKMEQAVESMFKARVIESVLPQDNRNRQYLYIIKNPLNETIKIGVAQDVDKRIQQLQTGAGVELELVYRSMICSNAFNIERDVHQHFEKHRTFGEWFKMRPEDAIEFIEQQTFVLKSEFNKYLGFVS